MRSFNSMVKSIRKHVKSHRSDKYDVLDELVSYERSGLTDSMIGADGDIILVKVPSLGKTYTIYLSGSLASAKDIAHDELLWEIYQTLNVDPHTFDEDGWISEIVEEDY